MNKVQNLGKIFLLTLALGFCFTGKVFASDNVLQAIQIDGAKDSYNIILKSDDVAELKKTIQSPNKMVLNLKGIRASKTINTIYNNTASVDSVVVEPTSDDSVKIFVQADNVNNANVHFDTLKTPLGVLDNSENKTSTDELVLNDPMTSYKPVYDKNAASQDEGGFSIADAMASPTAKGIKKALKGEKTSLLLAFGMFAMVLIGGIKAIKGKDSEIKVGLSQSLRNKGLGNIDMDLYNELNESFVNNANTDFAALNTRNTPQQQLSGNYGLKAYQDGMRSPYATPEIARPRPAIPHPASPLSAPASTSASSLMAKAAVGSMQNTIARPTLKTAPTATSNMAARAKTTNIDSIKFLESMTKIYEKNGRTDLAQGLKANMKKAKANLV